MGVLLFAILLFIYFIPSIVGYNRSDFTQIFLLNLLLGWTLLGWVIALIWGAGTEKQGSTSVETSRQAPNETHVSKSIADELNKLLILKDKGLITEEEFMFQRAKLLND